MHVPRSLQVSLEGSPTDEDGEMHPLQLHCYDPCEARLASMEAQRILDYLHDPRDRMIVFMRAIESMKWDDIGIFCHCSGRTARTRYSQACAFLHEALSCEQTAEQQGQESVYRLRVMPPALKRVSAGAMSGRARSERKRQAVFDAVGALMEEKKPITKETVLSYAHVSSAFLRSHPDLAQMITTHSR